MENTERVNADATGIQSLLDQYLAARKSLRSSVGETSFHLDEDSLTAFAEGTISQRESVPVVAHLVDCGFCRHKTAELVILDLELAAENTPRTLVAESEPSKISKVLNDVLAKIFGTGEEAVFAHNEEEKKDDDTPPEQEK